MGKFHVFEETLEEVTGGVTARRFQTCELPCGLVSEDRFERSNNYYATALHELDHPAGKLLTVVDQGSVNAGLRQSQYGLLHIFASHPSKTADPIPKGNASRLRIV